MQYYLSQGPIFKYMEKSEVLVNLGKNNYTLSATRIEKYDSIVSYLRETVSYFSITKNPLLWKTSTWSKKIRPSVVCTYGTNNDKEKNPDYVCRRVHTRKRKLKSNNLVPCLKRTAKDAARTDPTQEVSGTTSLDGSFSDLFGI